MTTSSDHPWISRRKAQEIYEIITSQPAGVTLILLEAPAGVGKTYLLRDIGVRLGSESGYDAGHSADLYWSGIIDLYDPEATTKRIEQRWMEAFKSISGYEFNSYRQKRESYEISAKAGMMAAEQERLVEEIRSAFADGMHKSLLDHYPVMVFDTVERLETILDPAQKKLAVETIEKPDVLTWLIHQLSHLSRGVILMVGRPVPALKAELRQVVDDINPLRKTRHLAPVEVQISDLKYLTADEQKAFFENRVAKFPRLSALLNDDLKTQLGTHTQGNPLLLDIALQTLLETRDPVIIRNALDGGKGISAVEDALIGKYMNSGTSERQMLLTYLAIARNGLEEGLLRFLEKEHYPRLIIELREMAKLPFIKVRETFTPDSDGGESQKPTYFLHDEMYAICDRVGLIAVGQVREVSKKICEWYDQQMLLHSQVDASGERRSDTIKELLIESLPYRLRSDPRAGYVWYLVESDKAIRAAERGLEMGLQAAMAQFMSSAGVQEPGSNLPDNAIDREILKLNKPGIFQDFEIDSTLLWLKRYSARGSLEKAFEIADKASWVREAFLGNRERYLVTFAEFLLWQGQSKMYTGQSLEALAIYNQALDEIVAKYPIDRLEQDTTAGLVTPVELARICLVTGRLFNNRGYIYWYQGKYWLAIDEFNEALRYFGLPNLVEEIANSKDNKGRVYANLGYRFQALEEINEGLKLRILAGSAYREALSRNSLAIIYGRFNKTEQALAEIETAMKTFAHYKIQRGIALGHFTRGVTYRRRARETDFWENPDLTKDEALRLTFQAEDDLLDAFRIFSEFVQEPIRKIQICNELACCYRARYELFKEKIEVSGMKKALTQSRGYFDMAIDMSQKANFYVDRIDNLIDRAVLFNSAGMIAEAQADLAQARDLIPAQYQIQEKNGFPGLAGDEQPVDVYYRLLSQIEQGSAALIQTRDKVENLGMGDARVIAMMEHFTLAAAYVNEFSAEAFTLSQINNRVYTCLRNASTELVQEIRDRHLPEWLQKYALPAEPIFSQLNATFSTLLPAHGRSRGQSARR